MDRTLGRAVSLVAGVVAGGGVYWLGVNGGLAATIGIGTVVAASLSVRLVEADPALTSGESWRENLRTAGLVAFVTLVGFNGVLMVPVAFEYQVALYLLVGLSAYVGYAVGELDVIGRVESRGDRAATTAEPADD
jgi:hypothetical protein